MVPIEIFNSFFNNHTASVDVCTALGAIQITLLSCNYFSAPGTRIDLGFGLGGYLLFFAPGFFKISSTAYLPVKFNRFAALWTSALRLSLCLIQFRNKGTQSIQL